MKYLKKAHYKKFLINDFHYTISNTFFGGLNIIRKEQIEHSYNGQNLCDEIQGETAGEDFGWSKKLAEGEVNYEHNKQS
jgi:hypothetical protein